MAKDTPDYASGRWADAFAPRRGNERRHWLVKSEPATFSWDDLQAAPRQTTRWDGVRNHAARNFLRDGMRKGDQVFFYHSSTNPQAIVGICEVVREGYADPTALDAAHDGHDPKSTGDVPIWYAVDLRAVESLDPPVTLAGMKQEPALAEMALLRIGRLSVTPVTANEWSTILDMSRAASA